MGRKREHRYFHFNNKDGLEINSIHSSRGVSRYKTRASIWDDDHIVMDDPDRPGKYIHVSVMKQVRLVNRAKGSDINGYNGKINGRRR